MSTSKRINILIPTYKRLKALAVTLTSLCYQSEKSFDIIVSDQSADDDIERDNSIQTIKRWLELQNNKVTIYKNLPRRGMAQQRQFLLDHSNAAYSLFLDDDLLMEPFVLRNMLHVLESEQCGFVGCAVIGLSYKDDHRPQQQQIEFWKDHVVPEKIIPQSNEWQRYKLHSAAIFFMLNKNIMLLQMNRCGIKLHGWAVALCLIPKS